MTNRLTHGLILSALITVTLYAVSLTPFINARGIPYGFLIAVLAFSSLSALLAVLASAAWARRRGAGNGAAGHVFTVLVPVACAGGIYAWTQQRGLSYSELGPTFWAPAIIALLSAWGALALHVTMRRKR